MSLKSVLSNSVKSNCEQPQWVKQQQLEKQQQSSTETNVKFAGDEAKDRLYEPKHKKKLVRVLTVVAYIFSVSLAAIMLSLYYLFIWNPNSHLKNYGNAAKQICDTVGVKPLPLQQVDIDVVSTTATTSSGSDTWPTTPAEEIVYNNLELKNTLVSNSLLVSKLIPNYDGDTNSISNETLYK